MSKLIVSPVGAGGGAFPIGPAGGDLTGTYPNPLVQSLTGIAGAVTMIATAFLYGAAPRAAAGTHRFPNTTTAFIAYRNAGNSDDVFVVSGNASNDVIIGTTGTQKPQGISAYLLGEFQITRSSTKIASLAQASTDFVAFGQTTSATGFVRAPNATTIATFRNAANTADVIAIANDASNNVQIGGTNAAGVVAKVGATTVASLSIASGDFVSLGATPSATGLVRFANAPLALVMRNSGNTGDVQILKSGSAGSITFGDDSGLSASIDVFASSFIQFRSQTSVRKTGTNSFYVGSTGAAAWGISNPAADTGPLGFTTIGTITSVSHAWSNTATGNGGVFQIGGQSSGGGNGNGGSLIFTPGDPNGTGLRGRTILRVGSSSTMIECAQVTSSGRVVSLCLVSDLTTTQMPANTGDGVVFLASAVTVPTANPVGGAILYVDSTGNLKMRGSAGTVTTLAAA